jgi:secreted PhoX family phosphatase
VQHGAHLGLSQLRALKGRLANPAEEGLSSLPLSRRQVLQGGVAAAVAAMFGLPGCATAGAAASFKSVPVSKNDTLVVPEGYRADVLFAWGDPVGAAAGSPPFCFDASNSAAEQALQAGMHHDGMQHYPLPYGSNNAAGGLLAMNHEYHSDGLLFPDGAANWSAAKAAKAIAASGVSVIEIEQQGGSWRVVRPSRYARRITADTPCTVSGPAAGSDLLKTAKDPTGREVLGTFAGCAHGWTPWGTYLTCEENFQERFVNAGTQSALQKRDLIPAKSRANWEIADDRFDAAKHPNEPNRFGWVVEIDPYEPDAKPIKRTALGRCSHESATPSLAPDGRLAIYTGDDKVFEYVYKFVSRDRVDADRAKNRAILDQGTLYVARFNADGTGTWLPLVHGQNGLTAANGFRDQGEVLVKTRMAADVVGATKMDRPEWVAVNEKTREVVITLTNNTERGAKDRPGTDTANPRANNLLGHIVRWREANDDPTATTFRWDMLALAGNPAASDPAWQGNFKGDAFANPDGVRFDPSGRLWITTDISPSRLNKGEFEMFGNNQILMVDPASGVFRRFLTGPVGCEVTGLAFTPDGRTAFVNIQHPGEIGGESNDPKEPSKFSNWPDYRPDGRPRSATVVIRRIDGGVIGG